MPPKVAPTSQTTKLVGPTKEQLAAINIYLAQRPDFETIIEDARAKPPATSSRSESDCDRALKEAVKTTLNERRKEAETNKSLRVVNMPVHPKEETTEDNLYDKVAKNSKDSTASDHPIHHEKDKATIDHHRANPGPVMAENLPEAASREELRKRAEELNKKA